MQQPRPSPFDLAFAPITSDVLPAIQTAVAASGRDPRDRDGFLLLREVLMVLRDLRPEEGIGEGIDQLAALVHHAYLFWSSGSVTVEIPDDLLEELVRGGAAQAGHEADTTPRYIQLPLHRIWAQVVPGEPHEPLDGAFVHTSADGQLRVLGVFGVHPDRPGFSVVEVSGARAAALARPDGSPLFHPTLPGGAAAGLYSIAGPEELLELGARSWELGAEAGSSTKLPAPSS